MESQASCWVWNVPTHQPSTGYVAKAKAKVMRYKAKAKKLALTTRPRSKPDITDWSGHLYVKRQMTALIALLLCV